MKFEPWFKRTADDIRKCAVCGNRRDFGYYNTSTRQLLCGDCIKSCTELAFTGQELFDERLEMMALAQQELVRRTDQSKRQGRTES